MRYRQVHLDFHTSEAIETIGNRFSKLQFQEMLRKGHVDSITIFAKCHHGWSYFPSEYNELHPGLSFDLLGAMIEAAHEIDVRTPVYLSAGFDEKWARKYPGWLIRNVEDHQSGQSFLEPGYHQFCMNTPYLNHLVNQVKEVVQKYDGDGIFLDIVGERMCYCQYCVASLREAGQDPRDPIAVRELGKQTYKNYTVTMRKVIDSIKPGHPLFHNSGHITRGRRDLAHANSHQELESLPTGGWGYDHFPLSARYAATLGMDYLGMTGKFHTTWGEFGGYKHPNALRYETALSLAHGARCSIGDQLPPDGAMDTATYELIGKAYREVEEKEPWCRNTTAIADIALLSLQAVENAGLLGKKETTRESVSDNGASRMLIEGQYLFNIIDLDADFTPYKVLILPDGVSVDAELRRRINDYCSNGGKLLATGSSGMDISGDGFALDLGVRWLELNPYCPDYFRPSFPLKNWGGAAFIQIFPGTAY